MSHHQVLSRKYRPQAFSQLVGQEHVARILENAITSGRVGHAYLFVGPRGVGKTTSARIFAKALNCAEAETANGTPEPCGRCPSCRDIASGNDLDVVEMDAASNNHVEDVRRLREQVGYATVRSRHRIWIVDEVHMLSLPAFNAFLKTLEEPPEGVVFLFCTTEEHKLPDTFRSRCQRVEFRPIDAPAMAARLADLAAREGVEAEEGLLDDVAAAALGGLRDAESLLEQLISASPSGRLARADLDALAGRAPGRLLEALQGAVGRGDAAGALDAVDGCLASGAKPGVLLDQWMEALRATLARAARGEGGSLAATARAIDVLLEKRAHLRAGADGPLVLEVAAVELARLPDARDLDGLLEALRQAPRGAVDRDPVAQAPPPASVASAPVAGEPVAPSGPRPTGPVPLGIGAVRAGWDRLVEAAGRDDGRLAAALARAVPAALDDERVVLEVDPDDHLARSALGRREAVRAFRGLAREAWGRELPYVLTEVRRAAAAPAEPTPRPHEHPAIRRVTEKTGGRLLDVDAGGGDAEDDS